MCRGRNWPPSRGAIERLVPQNRCAAHDASVRQVIVDREMLRAAIVPEGDAAWLPAPANDELRPLDVFVQEFQYGAALARHETIDACRETEIDEEALLASFRMRADDRVRDRRILLSRFFIAIFAGVLADGSLRPERAHEVVHGFVCGEIVAKAWRERIARRRHARPHGIAAGRRKFDCVKDGTERWRLDEGDVGVPRVVIRRVAGMVIEYEDFRRAFDGRIERMNVKRAEAGGKVALLRGRKLLVFEEDHLVFQ